jgi:uncharacterized protein YkwD
MRIVIRCAAVLTISWVFVLLAWTQASTTAERQLFAAANQARRAQGLPALRWDEALATAARRHALQMAKHGAAQHVFAGEATLPSRATQAGCHFYSLSENVVQGASVEAVYNEFLRSPNHRANLLDADIDSIGVGVAERDGQLFVVEDFSKAKQQVTR